MGGGAGGLDEVGAIMRRARDAASASRWDSVLDLAAQAMAIDPATAGAGELIGEARRRLALVGDNPGQLRQLTVMFADLENSTGLAAAIGAERFRRLMLELYALAVDAVTRYDGRVAKYLGDGVLAHFGHPRAHDDDARRAVLAGLAFVDAVRAAGDGWKATYGRSVAVAAGIATGTVAIGPVAGAPWYADDVFGDAPNIASRVQSSAAPMTVRIEQATFDLVEGWFEVEELGPATLRNFPRPVELYRVLAPTDAETRSEARRRPAAPVVGRSHELAVLRQSWFEATRGGARTVVAITGDGGLGKSRLLESTVGLVSADGGAHVTLPCSAIHSATPLHPVRVALRRFFRAADGTQATTVDDLLARLGELEHGGFDRPHAAAVFARLLELDGGIDLPPDELRRAAFDAVTQLVDAVAADQPLLLSIDDMDLADPSTTALLEHFLEHGRNPVLVLATGRRADLLEVADRRLQLSALEPAESSALVRSLAPGIDGAGIERIVALGAGVPLFLEELTRRRVADPDARLDTMVHLTGFLTARLDELPAEARRLLETIAVLGEEAPIEAVWAMAGDDHDATRRALKELDERRVVVLRPDATSATVRIRHGLLQQVAYDSLVQDRKRDLHRRAAVALASVDAIDPTSIARHHQLAGDSADAARAWLEAGGRSAATAANEEALELFNRGLAAVGQLPPGTEAATLELALRFGVGTVEATVHGYTAPLARAAFERAAELGETLGSAPHLFPATWGGWTYWYVLGEHAMAGDLAERCLQLALDNPEEPRLRWEAGAVMGYQRFAAGAFAEAADELAVAVRHIGTEPLADFPQDPGIVCHSLLAVARWFTGDAEASRAEAVAAQAEAAGLDPATRRAAFSQAWVGCNLAYRAELDGDHEQALALAGAAAVVAGERGYLSWLSAAMLHTAIAQCSLGDLEQGLPMLEAMVTAWRSVGTDADGNQLHPVLMTPYFAGRLAEFRLVAGNQEGARSLVDELLRSTATSGERFWDAELLRTRAMVRAAADDRTGAVADLEAAVALAREQGSPPLQARAAGALAHFEEVTGR